MLIFISQYQFVLLFIIYTFKLSLILGHCKCGAKVKCAKIESRRASYVLFECVISSGSGKCNKRQMRQPTRSAVGASLKNKSAHVYRCEKAANIGC